MISDASNQSRIEFGLGGLCAQSVSGGPEEFNRELHEIVRLAQTAEAEGLDSVWLSEHHFSSDCYLPSVIPMMAALASQTERVRISSNVALAPLYDPVRLAEDAAVLDHLSRGRAMLGLGLGYRAVEFEGFGRKKSRRGRDTDELLAYLKGAWAGDAVRSPDGTTEVVVTPPPFTKNGPAVLIGAFARAGLERARRADGWIAPLFSDVAHAQRRVEMLKANPDDALDGYHVALSFTGFVSAGDAWDDVRAGALHVEGQYRRWMIEAGDVPGLKDELPTDAPPSHLIVGNPDEVAARLRPWAEFLHALPSGAIPHIVVRLTWPSVSPKQNAESVRLFAREVVPQLAAELL